VKLPRVCFTLASAVTLVSALALVWPLSSSRADDTGAKKPAPVATVAATPVATPTPLPFGTPSTANCNTGAQGRPSTWGVSGGNINSIGSDSCCTGTFGSMVEDASGNDYILSNNHVLARTSSTTRSARAGEALIQPGLADTGCYVDSGDAVAQLSHWMPLNFASGSQNTMDVAIAKVTPGMMDPTGSILNIGPISASPFAFADAAVGMYVQKNGRTSCLTLGQVEATDTLGKVQYEKGCGAMNSGIATFNHQILIQGVTAPGVTPIVLPLFPPAPTGLPINATAAFAGPGDSGSLVVTTETCPRAVGLLFAGGEGLTVVNPIERVLDSMSVSMVGGCTNTGSSSDAQPDFIEAAATVSSALKKSMDTVRAVKERHGDELLKLDDVTAVGIGAGPDSDQAGLVIFVKQDTPQVRKLLPKKIDGVPVQIVQSGIFQAY
jgi:hypothetical protein